jgi:hypothetical protein
VTASFDLFAPRVVLADGCNFVRRVNKDRAASTESDSATGLPPRETLQLLVTDELLDGTPIETRDSSRLLTVSVYSQSLPDASISTSRAPTCVGSPVS